MRDRSDDVHATTASADGRAGTTSPTQADVRAGRKAGNRVGTPAGWAPSLRTSLLLGLGYVALLATVALGVPLALNLQARVDSEVRSQALGQADVLAASTADMLTAGRRAELDAVVQSAAQTLRGRVIVVDLGGVVLADSAGPRLVGTSYASRPEVAAALTGRRLQVQRSSRTLGEQILATAAPIVRGGATVGAVRVTQSVAAVNDAVRRVEVGLGIAALVVLAIGLGVGAFIARTISRPLLRLERVAGRVASGQLDARAPLEGSREQRSLSASFNEMAQRIGRLLDSQKAFVADASHQLRTPLTGLRLRLEEAHAAVAEPQAAKEIEAGIAEVDRLAGVVSELLLLSRAGERESPGELTMLDEVAAAAIDRWRPAAGERGIALELRQRGGAAAWCARADVDRALDALVENALCYSPAGSAVEIASLPGRVEVRDRGLGVQPDELEALFERFHRGSASRSAPGSGLGLSIARELTRAWDGDVRLAPRPGGGTIATLSLPAPAAAPRGGLPR